MEKIDTNNSTSQNDARDLENQYESTTLKSGYPQIIAAIIAASFQLSMGFIFSYSAILIPQIESATSDVVVTKNDTSWIASIAGIAVSVGAILAGLVIDRLGRLNTIKFAAIPSTIGWISIALASNVSWLIFGRILTGLGCAIGSGPGIVYITEISRPNLRGALISLCPTIGSLGILITYVNGTFLSWRLVAWICIALTIIPVLLLHLFVPESPVFLVARGRIDEASASLKYLYKNYATPTNSVETISNFYLKALIKQKEDKDDERRMNNAHSSQSKCRGFLKPTGYKPLLVLFFFFLIQQFSGIYITLFYAVTFFQDAKSGLDAHHASILVGCTRFIMSLVSSWLLMHFKRRSLIMISAIGMAVMISTFGLFTKWTAEQSVNLTWIPVVFFLLYVGLSTVGMLPIPWIMTAELYPNEIRGLGQSISFSIGNILIFCAVMSYRPLLDFFGSSARVQWFFACICVAGFFYALLILPETYGKKLSEIENHFRGKKTTDNVVEIELECKIMLERPIENAD